MFMFMEPTVKPSRVNGGINSSIRTASRHQGAASAIAALAMAALALAAIPKVTMLTVATIVETLLAAETLGANGAVEAFIEAAEDPLATGP